MRLDDTAGLRRIILRIMLGALAVWGALAVVGVLVGKSSEESFRMIGTGVAATIASGLLLASCKFLDSGKYRRTGLFVMAMILAQFITVLIALWGRVWMSGFYITNDAPAASSWIFPVVWVPASLFFHIRQLRGGRLAGLFGIIFCALGLVFFLLGIWADRSTMYGPMNWNYWETGWACWFFSFGAAACAAGAGSDHKHWRWIGLTAAFVSLGLGTHDIWTSQESVSTLFVISTTLAILIGHVNLLWLCPLKPRQNPLRWVTAVCALIAGATLDYATLERVNEELIIWRIGTAAIICGGCGTVAVAILAAFNRRIAPHSASGIDVEKIDLICPICRKKQSVPIKDGAAENTCVGCGLIISMKVTAPRCPSCDYVLLMIHADRCPECGAPIAGRPAVVDLPPPVAEA